MNCMEARRMVTPYIKGELSEKELEQFLKHIDQCSDCMDELDIYFTVYQAMDRLDAEDHPDYNFKRMLNESIHASKRRIVLSRVFRLLRTALFLLTDLLLLLCIITGIQLSQGESVEPVFQRIWLNFYGPAELIEQESELSTEELSEIFSEVIKEREPLRNIGQVPDSSADEGKKAGKKSGKKSAASKKRRKNG